MKALYFTPGKPNSARLKEVQLPQWNGKSVRAKLVALGVCGTDRDLLAGNYGWAPQNEEELIIGHESLAEVIKAPENSEFQQGDLVVGIVRHPDPVPCVSCAIDEWDMCKNGLYTEHGIKERHGFAKEIIDLDPDFIVKVNSDLGRLGVLLEPASIVAKAWEHIESIGLRARFQPKLAVITGAGPVGLLAALMAIQRNLEVHVLDLVQSGPKVDAVKSLGAVYHHDRNELQSLCNKVDIVMECTGVDNVVLDMIKLAGPGGIVCLAGVSSGGRKIQVDMGSLNRSMVLENEVVFGSVNANKRHYQKAAEALNQAPRDWLSKLITREVPLINWQEAFKPSGQQIKTILVP